MLFCFLKDALKAFADGELSIDALCLERDYGQAGAAPLLLEVSYWNCIFFRECNCSCRKF